MLSHHSIENNVIAIVGCGLSGISTFCQLIKKLIEESTGKYKILLIEKQKNQFGTGIPYTTDSPLIWTLNNPASKMQLMEDGITMAEWMNEARDQWESLFPNINEEYPPRALVGLFIKTQYEIYKKKSISHGIVIEECFEEIIDLDQVNDQWQLFTNAQSQYLVNTLFLCLGHAPNNQFAHLANHPHFFPTNAPLEDLKKIPDEADVYMIGGQATSVDVLLWLAYEKHHTGRIHVMTRNPPILTTKGNKDVCDASSINELTNTLKTKHENATLPFAEAKLLFWNSYRQAAKNPINSMQLPRPQTALLYQIKKYKQQSDYDESIGNVDELRSFIFHFYFSGCYAEFWNKLKDDEKEIFKEQFYSFIFAYLTGITPLNAQLLLKLYDRNLIIEKSGLTSIQHDGNKFILQFSNENKEEADYLIDSSGLGYDISKRNVNFPLLSNVIRKGFIVPTKFGGMQLNDYGQAFNRENTLQSNLFCIGPSASYCHPAPTPYASFIAIAEVKKALAVLNINLKTFKLRALYTRSVSFLGV